MYTRGAIKLTIDQDPLANINVKLTPFPIHMTEIMEHVSGAVAESIPSGRHSSWMNGQRWTLLVRDTFQVRRIRVGDARNVPPSKGVVEHQVLSTIACQGFWVCQIANVNIKNGTWIIMALNMLSKRFC